MEVMVVIGTLDEYKEKRYSEIEVEFFRDSLLDWEDRTDEIRLFLQGRLQDAVVGAARAQVEAMVPCSNLSISLPLVSVFRGRPVLLVDFYDEAWFYGSPFYRRRIPADIFFSRWQEFICRAEDDAFYQRSTLRKTMIRTLYVETLEQFAFQFACEMKVWLANMDMDELLNGLTVKVPFYLSMGTYYDAQKPVYALLPSVDLLTAEESDLSLQHFDRKIYRQRVLERKNLQLSRFTDCLFEPATLQKLDLRDAIFQDCRFHHVNFSEVKIAGSTWRNCTFADCTFAKVTAAIATDGEFYAVPVLEHCRFQEVHMRNCDWCGCVLQDCVDAGITFADCQLENSGWLDFGG